MSLNLLDVITLSAIIPLLIFSLFFLFKLSKKNISNLYLGILLLVLGLYTLNYFFLRIRENLPEEFKYVFYIGSSLSFLLGPALFTYAKSIFEVKISFKKELLHYLIFPISILYYFFIFRNHIEFYYTIKYLQILFYLFLVFQIVFTYQEKLKNYFSNIYNNEIIKFKIVLIIFSFLWLIDVFALLNFLFLKLPNIVNESFAFISMSLTFILPYFLIYYSLIHSKQSKQTEILSCKEKSKIEHQGAEEYAAKIERFLKENKPFLNPNLSLKELSDNLNISPRIVSYAINSILKKSFYDLINYHRIEEAKKLLNDKNNNLNVLEICYKVGFNSKSAFNSSFKKFTNLTPSKFKN